MSDSSEIIRPRFGWLSLIRRMEVMDILNFVNPNKEDTILDIGSGTGQIAEKMSKQAKKVVCIDIIKNSKMLEIANKNENIDFKLADARKLPFKDKTFDKVVLSSTLQMIHDDYKVLTECRRVMKNNGKIIISVPSDFVFIKKIIKKKKYAKFVKDLDKGFGAHGKGRYGKEEFFQLLKKNKFNIDSFSYTPKIFGTIIYEFLLVFSRIFRLPAHNPFYNIFYPLSWLDALVPKSKGCEIIVRASKM